MRRESLNHKNSFYFNFSVDNSGLDIVLKDEENIQIFLSILSIMLPIW